MSAIRCIGDAGGLYVPEALAAGMRDRLMPIADIATPNRYELEWLAGAKLDDLRSTMAAALAAGAGNDAGDLGAVDDGRRHRQSAGRRQSQALLAEHRIVERPPNGLGDLTAAVFLRASAGRPAGGQGAAVDHGLGL